MSSRIIWALCALLFTCTFTAQPASAQRRGQVALPTKSLLAKYGLEREWWNQAVVHKSGDTVRYLTVDEHFLYVQTKAGNITAIDVKTGKRVWYYRFGAPADYSSRIINTEESIYFVSGSHLVCMDRFRGTQSWTLRLPNAITSQLHIDDEQIFFGDITGMFYALDLGRAQEFAEKGYLPASSYDTINWRFRSADQVVFTPYGIRGNVVFISRDGTLYSIDKDSRVDQLQFEPDSGIAAPMTVRGERIFLSVADPGFRLDQRVFRIHERTGRVEWQKVMTQPVLQPMVLIENNLFVTPLRAGTSLLEAEYGSEIWNNPNAMDFIAMTESYVFASDQYKNILVINRENGTTLSRMPLRDFTFRMRNDQNDRLYIATPDGIVVSIHEEGAKFPTYYKGVENNPIEPEFAVDEQQDEQTDENQPEPTSDAPEDAPAPQQKPEPKEDDSVDDFFN